MPDEIELRLTIPSALGPEADVLAELRACVHARANGGAGAGSAVAIGPSVGGPAIVGAADRRPP